MNLLDECRALPDLELEQALKFLAEREKHNLAKLLAHLAEHDRRQLCVKRGDSTLFFYCVRVLGYDEGGAYRRIRAARVARQWPEVLELIERGELHLTALIVLHPILKNHNRKELFALAKGKTRRELDALVAARLPRPPHADFTRRVSVPQGWSVAVSAPPMAVETTAFEPAPVQTPPTGLIPEAAMLRPWEWQAVVPVAMDRVRIGFDAGISVMKLIDRARQVLRHKYPAGRLEDVMKEALEILLERKDPQRRLELKKVPLARESGGPAPSEPRFLRNWKSGRYVPARVKQSVWQRDGGRCAWRFDDGTLCGSRDALEYDHVRPFAKGGRSDTPRNIRLLCRLHNRAAAAASGLSVGPADG